MDMSMTTLVMRISSRRYDDRPSAGPTSPLHHAQRHQAGHFAGDAGGVDDIDDSVDVLVGQRRFLGQLGGGGAADHDALALELPAQIAALDDSLGGGPAHG